MTKHEFVQRAFISAIQGIGTEVDGDKLTDLYDTIESVAQAAEDSYWEYDNERIFDKGLASELTTALDNCQAHGGFCIQFNQDYPLNVNKL